MTEFVKKHRFVGLALAVAAGYVLAHLAISSLDYFYENELDSKPQSAIVCVAFIVIISLLSYQYGGRFVAFFKRRRRIVLAVTCASIGVLALSYIAFGVASSRRSRKREVAQRAYSDEYERRYAQFAIDHVGASREEFSHYEAHPHALYGYAKTLKNMKDHNQLFDLKKFGIRSPTYKEVVLDDPIAEDDRQKNETNVRHLAEETSVDVDIVRANFEAIRKRAQREEQEHQAREADILQPLPANPSFLPLLYENEYLKRLGDNENPTPAMERDLYDEIVLGKRHR